MPIISSINGSRTVIIMEISLFKNGNLFNISSNDCGLNIFEMPEKSKTTASKYLPAVKNTFVKSRLRVKIICLFVIFTIKI